VVAGCRPAARALSSVRADEDALSLPAVDRADGPGLFPHVRRGADLSLLRSGTASVGHLGPR
jgi:hypothetical protein